MRPGARHLLLLAACLLPASAAAAAAADGAVILKEVELDESLWKWRGRLADSIGLRVGEPYSPAAAVRAVDLLRATGDFSSVDLVTRLTPEGASIRLEALPRELVSEVSVRGNLHLLKREIRPAIRTVRQEHFDRATAEKDAENIRELYARRGFFGTEVRMSAVPDRDGWGLRVAFDIKEGSPAVIQRVGFEGNRGIGAEELLEVVRMHPYTFYAADELQEASERLTSHYRRKGYITARVETEVRLLEGESPPAASPGQPLKSLRAAVSGQTVGVAVTFRVTEGDRYDIRIEGNRGVDGDTLRGLLSPYRSGFLDQYEMEESREAILKHYRNNGWHRAEVDAELGGEGRRALFHIREGPKAKIVGLVFRGNASFSSKDLAGMTDSRPGAFAGKLYRADVLAEDLKKILAFYVSKGFLGAAVTLAEPGLNAAGDEVRPVIEVAEGPRALVSAVTFTGQTVFEEGRLKDAAGLPPGGSFSPDWVEEAKKRVLDLYSRLGYADCSIGADLSFSGARDSVTVAFQVREGKRRLLGRVLVAGNRRTNPRVVTRELDLREGEPYDPIKLLEGRRRLFDTGLFTRVEVTGVEQPASGDTDVIVRVREREAGRLAVGVGYDSEERARGFVEFSENNLWGTARAMRLRFKLSSIGRRYDVILREPWALGFRQDANLNLYEEYKEEPGYDLRRQGARLFSDRSLDRYLSLYMAYRFEKVDYTRVDPGVLSTPRKANEFLISSLIARLTYDRRDSVVSPHRGYLAAAGAEFAPGFLGSEARFNKYEAQGAWVQPLGSESELVLAVRGAGAQRLFKGSRLPISERFFAGGAHSVRGYSEKSLGPKNSQGTPLGGDLLLVGNLEIRSRLYRGLGGVVFLDAGNVWARVDEFDPAEVKISVGAGVRYETPVGPVRLEYGLKLDPAPGEDRWRLHFTLGNPF